MLLVPSSSSDYMWLGQHSGLSLDRRDPHDLRDIESLPLCPEYTRVSHIGAYWFGNILVNLHWSTSMQSPSLVRL